jgi:protein TonB
LAVAQTVSGFSNNDQLGLSFFGSVLLHLVIILGVTFVVPKVREVYGLPTLEIILVQTESKDAPDDAELLAQANQAGGGTAETEETARNPIPVRELGEANLDVPIMQPPPQPQVTSPNESMALMTKEQAANAIEQTESKPEATERQIAPENLGLVTRPAIALERARLIAEIDQGWTAYQQRPHHKYLNARTREYKYAVYMTAWQAKVERVGNLNYPEEAKRRGLSGQLRLDVALNSDGSVNAVVVRKSSGSTLLDDAAKRIVYLASPFAPFPSDIRKETDILHIMRTWRFNEGALTGY